MFPACVLETETVTFVMGPEGTGCIGRVSGGGVDEDAPLEHPERKDPAASVLKLAMSSRRESWKRRATSRVSRFGKRAIEFRPLLLECAKEPSQSGFGGYRFLRTIASLTGITPFNP
jgi:hypothetical protein